MKKLTASTVGTITCSFLVTPAAFAQTSLPVQLKELVSSSKHGFKTIPLNYKLKDAISSTFLKDADSSIFYHAVFAKVMPAEKAKSLTNQLLVKVKTALQPDYTYYEQPAIDGIQQNIFINNSPNSFEIIIVSAPYKKQGNITMNIFYGKNKRDAYQKEITSIIERASKIIANNLNVDIKKVIAKASFTKDLGADSLDVVELTMEFEKEFHISIPDKDVECMLTVGKFTTYLVEHAGNQ